LDQFYLSDPVKYGQIVFDFKKFEGEHGLPAVDNGLSGLPARGEGGVVTDPDHLAAALHPPDVLLASGSGLLHELDGLLPAGEAASVRGQEEFTLQPVGAHHSPTVQYSGAGTGHFRRIQRFIRFYADPHTGTWSCGTKLL